MFQCGYWFNHILCSIFFMRVIKSLWYLSFDFDFDRNIDIDIGYVNKWPIRLMKFRIWLIRFDIYFQLKYYRMRSITMIMPQQWFKIKFFEIITSSKNVLLCLMAAHLVRDFPLIFSIILNWIIEQFFRFRVAHFHI